MTSSIEQRINCNCLNDNTESLLNHALKTDLVSDGQIARIFNIQRYSLNDGNGIRTVVFFKGCSHCCPWCSNPESISRKIQIVRRKSKCLHCETCLNDVDECPSGALEKIGYDIDIDELVKQILKDEVFYRSSDGGVTLSGGEVLLQAKFARNLLYKLKQLGINTAIETEGDVKFDDFLSVAEQCDEVLFDFKIMDEQMAKNVIHIRLPRVLDNFTKLYQHHIHLIPRLPLIPDYTLSEENVLKVLAFLKPFTRINEIHILPFHQFGEPKYELIHQIYKMKHIKEPSESAINNIIELIKNRGYQVVRGG